MTLSRAPKLKECAYCGRPFLPFQSMQKVCATVKCARGYVKKLNAKRTAEWRERKAAANDKVPYWIKRADKAFAAYIRLRDQLAGHPCISSGKPLDWSGNQVDAGHYRSRGAASHLRYDERNCHAQAKSENRYKAGNIVMYRRNLLGRIGPEEVESLECNNEVHQWEVDELKAIEATYKAKRKELERSRA